MKALDAEKVAKEADTADLRLMKGCNTFVVAQSDPRKFGSISPGGRIFNPTTGTSLPPNTVGCDDGGTTGIMADVGKVEIGSVDVATTQNFALVKKAMQLHGINPQSGDGRIGGANAQIKH